MHFDKQELYFCFSYNMWEEKVFFDVCQPHINYRCKDCCWFSTYIPRHCMQSACCYWRPCLIVTFSEDASFHSFYYYRHSMACNVACLLSCLRRILVAGKQPYCSTQTQMPWIQMRIVSIWALWLPTMTATPVMMMKGTMLMLMLTTSPVRHSHQRHLMTRPHPSQAVCHGKAHGFHESKLRMQKTIMELM